jgi:hypothetical protein
MMSHPTSSRTTFPLVKSRRYSSKHYQNPNSFQADQIVKAIYSAECGSENRVGLIVDRRSEESVCESSTNFTQRDAIYGYVLHNYNCAVLDVGCMAILVMFLVWIHQNGSFEAFVPCPKVISYGTERTVRIRRWGEVMLEELPSRSWK